MRLGPNQYAEEWPARIQQTIDNLVWYHRRGLGGRDKGPCDWSCPICETIRQLERKKQALTATLQTEEVVTIPARLVQLEEIPPEALRRPSLNVRKARFCPECFGDNPYCPNCNGSGLV